MTADEFIARVSSAEPGERIVYFTGLLTHAAYWDAEVAALRAAAYLIGAPEGNHFKGLGVGSLVQARVHAGICDYILVMRRKPSKMDLARTRKEVARARVEGLERIANEYEKAEKKRHAA